MARPIARRRGANRPPWLRIKSYEDVSDREAWLRIQNEVLAERGVARGWGPAQFRRQLSNRPDWQPDRLLLAGVDGDTQLVATAVFEIDVGRGWTRVQWLLVRPRFRRRGIARELVREVERRAVGMGGTTLRVETLRSWHGAVDFYQAIGFREVMLNE